jgi:hypothetical protein
MAMAFAGCGPAAVSSITGVDLEDVRKLLADVKTTDRDLAAARKHFNYTMRRELGPGVLRPARCRLAAAAARPLARCATLAWEG